MTAPRMGTQGVSEEKNKARSKFISASGTIFGPGVTPYSLRCCKLDDEKRGVETDLRKRVGEAPDEKREGGFQRRSSVLTGANRGKLDQIFRLCNFNTQMRAYITMFNKCRANSLYNLF